MIAFITIVICVLDMYLAYSIGFSHGIDRHKSKKPTFYTHSPNALVVGEIMPPYGIVTKIERIENTKLFDGGSVPCYAIYCDPDLRERKP